MLNKVLKQIEEIKKWIESELILNFLDWIWIKIQISFKNNSVKYVKQWEIWNCYLGQNIDSEQNWDSNNNFYRPVLILRIFWTKVDNIIVLPITKSNKPDFISFKITKEKYNFLKEENNTILLDKVRVISKKRLANYKPFWRISKEDFEKIIKKFNDLIVLKDYK